MSPILTSKHCVAMGLVSRGRAAGLGSARLCRDTMSCSDISTCQQEEREMGTWWVTAWGWLRYPDWGDAVTGSMR